MPAIVLAWLAGEALIIYRSYKRDHRPPMPGQLLASSGLFALLGLMARNDQAKFLAGAMAWGFDIAAFLNLAPDILTGGTDKAISQAENPQPPKTAKGAAK
jgi:hypothetical protein